MRDVGEHDVQTVCFLTNTDIQNDVVLLSVCAFESQVPLADLVDVDAARKLMVGHLDADLLLLAAVRPVEHTRFLREDLERTKFFAVELNNLHRLKSAVHHQVTRLEANQFRERERLRQEADHCHEFEHSTRPGIVRLLLAVQDLYRTCMKSG